MRKARYAFDAAIQPTTPLTNGPAGGDEHPVRFQVDRSSSALLPIVYAVQSLIVLGILVFVAVIVWVIAVVLVLANESYGDSSLRFLLVVRWEACLFAYLASLETSSVPG